LGTHLLAQLSQEGWDLRALVRDTGNAELRSRCAAGLYPYSLRERAPEVAFNNEGYEQTALIHCAYAMRPGDAVMEENIRAALFLRDQARRMPRTKFVFISSMAAHSEARSFYGRGKKIIEESLDPQRDLIVKPGVILGEGGLYGRIARLSGKLPVLPVFYPQKSLQTIHVNDLCRGIARALAQDAVGVFHLAQPEAVSVMDFYRQASRGGAKLCAVPGDLILPLLRFAEQMGLSLPISSENLLGLKHCQYFPTAEDMSRLGI
jgi:nucleoside-diphosphate-sugar epimerase